MSTVIDSLIVKLEAEIAQYEAEMAKSQKVLDAVKKATDSLTDSQIVQKRTSEEVAMSLKKLDDRFREMDKAVTEFEKQVKEGERIWLSVATASEKYAHEISKLNKLLDAGAISQETFNRAAAKLEKEFGQGLSNSINKVGESLIGFGKKMTLAITTPVIGFGAIAVNEFAKFDQAMTRTQAIAGITADQVGKVRSEILAMSASGDVLQGPAELAKGLEALARVTQDSAQALQLLPQAANFATVAQLDLIEATNNLTEVQRAVGLASEDAAQNMENFTRVSDALVGATTISQLTVRQLSDSLTSLAGQTLRQFNKSIEEGTAVLIEFGRQGFTNARSGTMLSRILLQLSKASRDAAGAHKIFGLEVFNADGQMNHMADIVKQLTEITRGMTEEMTSATLELLGFDQITQRSLIPLLGFGDAIAKNQEELDKMGGITKRLSDDVMESFSNQVQVLKNRLTVLGIETASSLLPTIESLLDAVESALNWFNNLEAGTKDLIVTFGLFLAAIGPISIALGTTLVIYGQLVALIQAGTVAMGTATIAAGALQIAIYSLATLGIAALVIGITALLIKFSDWISGLRDLRIEQEKLIDFNNQLLESNKKITNSQIADIQKIVDAEERLRQAREMKNAQAKEAESRAARAGEIAARAQAMLDEGVGSPAENRVGPKTVDEALKKFEEEGSAGFLGRAGKQLEELLIDFKEMNDLTKQANDNQKELEKLITDSNKELKDRDKILEEQARKMEEGRQQIEKALNAARLAKEQEQAFKDAERAFEKHREDLKRAGEQVRQSLLTPVEEYAQALDKLSKLRLVGVIGPEQEAMAANIAAEKANKELNKEHNELLRRREQLLNQTLTPQEKYNRQLEEAQMLFDKGIINVGEFNSIVSHAFEELQGRADIDVRFHTSGLDGVEAQSAEAFSRIRATMSLSQPGMRQGLRGPDLMTGPSSQFRSAGQAQPQDVREMLNEMKEAREQRDRQIELLQGIFENSPNFVPADIS